MSADVPAGSDKPLSSIFWNGGPSTNPSAPPIGFIPGIDEAPPLKTVSITNTSDITIFPILRGANTGTLPSNLNPNNPGNYYDPQDFHNQEYRAYVGYVDATGQHLGLPAGAKITFRVPLVFWDSARGYIVTDGADLIPADPVNDSNPFRYDPNSTRGVSVSTDPGNPWVTQFDANGSGATAGLVMFYHAERPQGIALDAPAQLTEFTIRSPYLTHWLTEKEVAETTVEYNYDVSYVDSLTAPISMEAVDVPVPIPNNPNPPTIGKNYGWAGSNLTNGTPDTPGTMQHFIYGFVNNTGEASIGNYFGGKGWPEYYNPNGILNIPSGANLFANSPLNGQKSSYFTYGPDNMWMLSSGGSGPVEAHGGGIVLSTTTLRCDFLNAADRDKFFDVLQGWKNDGQEFFAKNSNQVEFGKVTDFVKSEIPNLPGVTITVAGPVNVTGGQSFVFYRTVSDYATTAITNLWYSWAQYYVNQFATLQPPTGVTGTFAANTNVIKLTRPAPASLAVGMTVTGSGIVPAQGTSVIILDISQDRKEIRLSQLSAAGGSGGYAFGKPLPMPFSNADGIKSVTVTAQGNGYIKTSPPKVTITGGGGNGALATAVVGDDGKIKQIVITNGGSGYTSAPTVQIEGNGSASAVANVGTYVTPLNLTFTRDQLQTARAFAGSVYAAMFAESSIPQFTVNNPLLPPPMSLVYTTIGCDTLHLPNSNAGASEVGANVRDLIKSILRGVYDFNQVPEAQWYPNPATWQGGQNFNVYNLDPYVWFVHEVLGLSGYGFSVDDDTSDVGAYASNYTPQMERVKPDHLEMVFSGLGNLPNQNKWYGNTQYGPITDTGTISNPTSGPNRGKTIVTLTDETKYWQIMPPGPTLIGAYVVGQGIPAGTIVTSMASSNGLVLVLSNSAPNAKNVSITVTGAAPVNPILNSGFELPIMTQPPPNNFQYDLPTSNNWDFNKTSGIAGNGSSLTVGNGPAPEGKQVGVIGARGAIRQKVNLQAGTYVLSFYAAQRKRGQTVDRQTINVLVDGNVVGTITPSGSNFTGYTVTFRVTAGQHIIGLADNGGLNDSTAFVDTVTLLVQKKPTAPLTQIRRQITPTAALRKAFGGSGMTPRPGLNAAMLIRKR
jgi:hypothetical protein